MQPSAIWRSLRDQPQSPCPVRPSHRHRPTMLSPPVWGLPLRLQGQTRISRQTDEQRHPRMQIREFFSPTRTPSPTYRLCFRTKVTMRDLCFTINPNSGGEEQDVPYSCSKSTGDAALFAPPVAPKSPGDIHFHLFVGGVQYWIVGKRRSWVRAQVGDEHPTLAGRLLSHRPPQASKFPNWVLASTYTTYIARDRRKKEAS